MASNRPVVRRSDPLRDLLFVSLLLVLLVGCAAGGLVDVWRDPVPPSAPLADVLVVAVKKDEARRRLLEDAFTTSLTQRGIRATPSYRLFAMSVPDTQQVSEAVTANGFDGILAVSGLETDRRRSVTPGYVTTEPRTRYNRWAQRYQTYFVNVRHPGYVETDRVVRHRVDVWSTREGGRLLWTGEGQSIDPGSVDQVNREITRLVVPSLEKSGLVPPPLKR